jgi:MFS family permease
METSPTSTHRWRFFRLGGFDQVRLDSIEDLLHLHELDQKLWAALSCPVNGLEFDRRTLALLDTDNDWRVRVPEILAAVSWIREVLRDLRPVMAGNSALPLAAIDDSRPEGKRLLAAARQLLNFLNKPGVEEICVDDVAGTETLLHDSPFNGDGVITPASARDEDTRLLIEEIMASVGSVQDRGGAPGISAEQVDTFFQAAALHAAWWDEAEAGAGTVLPLGDGTAPAAASVQALRAKIDDYFTRSALAAYDPKAGEALSPTPAAYESLSLQDLAANPELERFPLARIEAGRALPLVIGVNPAWAGTLATFKSLVVAPLIGDADSLDESGWDRIKAFFAPYDAWLGAKAGTEVEGLGRARIRAILADDSRERLQKVLEEDLSLAEQVESFEGVIRLVHYTRDLLVLLNNFVSFRDFYFQDRKAVFQAGTLYLDGRACELCVRVASPDTHATLAALSQTYLAYCRCTRRGSTEQMFIAAAFTGGDSDNLMVGRNGIFYDREGGDWDATIVKIVDHPISVSQAFWSPYKRVGRMIGDQIAKFAAAKDSAVDSAAGAKLADVGAKPDAAKAPFDVGKFAGIFAAIGLALGAIGTALATVLGGFMTLSLWQIPLAIGGIVLLVSGPSMLIAYLKLRQRNLGPVLDAGGWAVNTRARINIPFGATLTKVAELPKGAQRSLRDPFAEKKTPWKRWAILLALFMALGMAWDKGYIQRLADTLKPIVFPAATQTNATTAPQAPQPAGAPQSNQTK